MSDELLIEEIYNQMYLPIDTESTKTFDDLVKENSFSFDSETNDGMLYHATSIQALYSILNEGRFRGNSHGVTEEDYTISTSLNDNIVQYFSRDEHNIMFRFKIQSPFNVFVIPDWFHYLHTSSGLSFDTTEEDARKLAKEYNLRLSIHGLGENFLQQNLPQGYFAMCLPYVYEKYIQAGKPIPLQDESEITFIDKDGGMEMLFNSIEFIEIDGDAFESPEECLDYLTDNYEYEYLSQETDY